MLAVPALATTAGNTIVEIVFVLEHPVNELKTLIFQVPVVSTTIVLIEILLFHKYELLGLSATLMLIESPLQKVVAALVMKSTEGSGFTVVVKTKVSMQPKLESVTKDT